jgi:hypothetical protein
MGLKQTHSRDLDCGSSAAAFFNYAYDSAFGEAQ